MHAVTAAVTVTNVAFPHDVQGEFQLPSSPCPDLLITNSVPSDFQTNEIYKVILDAEEEGFSLDDEIAGMQRALDRLELQRAKLGDFVEAHRSVVSTIRRLPGEILGEIFSHYLDASASRAHSPEALSHLVGVCVRWRMIALASPMLWRHICPDIREDLSYDSPWEMQRIALQLQRSTPAALSISLHATSVNIIDLLLTESRRWQTLRLNTSPSIIPEAFNHVQG
ncbi:hypothetical protein GGX14DRAFT_403018 [Mycena pura]|uniref:F-box domain-containing protein n=1 Tax=Mycena pura TaxID=153505 RepID=A0AAD6UXF4_9AGAR|nr:hypothetical protein GGX14DRAFT_403018 [Mycena pura]